MRILARLLRLGQLKNNGGEFVRFVMSECEASSSVSEGCSDNLILVQEVYGECLSEHILFTATV